MGFGRLRFRRSFGQVKAQFRGARPKFYPLFTGLLDTYAGASAAYSLRRLSKIASSVVRVRRASDNAEKDFTADNITDGAMVNWVNGQIVPPLDIRELDSNGERTGSLVEAAAAYSLRNLSTSYTGDVVNARRNTDGATLDFSAAEVADGTLTNWVNTSFANALPLDTASGAAAAYSLRNLSTSYTGNVVDVRRSSDDAEDSFTAAEVADGTLTTWVGAGNDGFVTQWYDQSGNANHATQGTDASQPKIVDGGSLVSGGLDFDGVDDELVVSGNPVITANYAGTYSAFSVQKVSTNNKGYLYGNASVSNGSSLYAGDATQTSSPSFGLSNRNLATSFDIITRNSNESLLSAVYNNGDAGLLVNGGGTMTDAGTYDFAAGTNNFIIGNRNGGTSSGTFLDGAVKEIILYNSDQSDKRQAIEENIGSNYGITLTSSKDGTVSTWYDQSGNTNHATQTNAASQPKIVSGGVLVTGGIDFDGSDDSLSTGNLSLFTLNNVSSFVVSTVRTGGGAVASITELGESSNRFGSPYKYANTYGFRYGTEAAVAQPEAVNSTEALTSLIAGVSSAEGYKNGTSIKTYGTPNTTAIVGKPITIGKSFAGTPSCLVQEAIFYASDQSDNRTAIEANIGDTYNLDLPSGVDTGYDQVDGFVETWYDQSGNGNDAVQQVSGSQPKIVDAGVLVSSGIKFDGVDDYLVTTQGYIVELSQNPASVFCVATPDNINEGYLITEGDNPDPYSSNFILNGAGTDASTVWVNSTEFGSGFPASKALGGFIYNETTFQSYLNGSADGASGTATVNPEVSVQSYIGTRADGTTRFFSGKVEEIITYKSDQSANRVAIETNINNQYDIY